MKRGQHPLLKLCCSLCPLAALAFTSHQQSPFPRMHLDHRSAHVPVLPFRPLSRQRSRLDSFVASKGSSSSNDGRESFGIQPIYLILATAETIYWYWLAPGIDPASRWLAPADVALITEKLLDPSVVLSPPVGSGLGFSSLLLNSFLVLPAVWALLLLQEDGGCTPGRAQLVPPLPFCAAGFLVGGGALIPYMIVRRARGSPGDVEACLLPPGLRLFERRGGDEAGAGAGAPVGPPALATLLAVVLGAFAWPLLSGASSWDAEWAGFVTRAGSSQFTSLALFDLAMISTAVVDPMADDARRRGWLEEDASAAVAAARLAPYLFPLVGPVAWICRRPKYRIR